MNSPLLLLLRKRRCCPIQHQSTILCNYHIYGSTFHHSHHHHHHVPRRFLLNATNIPNSFWENNRYQNHDRKHHPPTSTRTIFHPFVMLLSQYQQRKTFWTRTDTSAATSNTNDIHIQKFVLSKFDMIDLEEYIYTNVTMVLCDPVLHSQTLSSLQWLQKRIGVSYTYDDDDNDVNNNVTATPATSSETETNHTVPNSESTITTTATLTLKLQLRLPSLLHPKLKELQTSIQENTVKHAQEWLNINKKVELYNNNSNHTTKVVVRVDVLPMVQPPVPIMSRFVEDASELLYNLGPGLTSVAHCVAVYSCKGGVGKSTVAVNLAYALAAAAAGSSSSGMGGGRIGLLDLDLYGPSLPVLVHPTDCTIRRSPLGTGLVYPITHENVKLLSLGFVNTNSGVPGSGLNNGASIMKGPMAVKVVSQLLKGTDWGALDVLILDLPPGTGDVQLAVLQQLQLSGAIAVSTPSKLATTDTRKGIEMFTSLGVPTIAVVENMSYFDDDTGKRHYPFGKGFMDHQEEQRSVVSDIPVKVVQLPISIVTNDANDSGIPLTLSRPKEATRELLAYNLLSNIVAEELLRLQYGSPSNDEMAELVTFAATNNEEIYTFNVANVSLHLDKQKGNEKLIVRIFSDTNAVQMTISSPSDLRARDPKTGDIMTDSPYLAKVDHSDNPVVVTVTKRSPSVIPIKVERRGRYGYAVEWADGATIIYSMRCLAKAAGGASVNM